MEKKLNVKPTHFIEVYKGVNVTYTGVVSTTFLERSLKLTESLKVLKTIYIFKIQFKDYVV